MASLVHFLMENGFTVRTFYLGQSESNQFTTDDQRLINEQSLDVDRRSSDQPPTNRLKMLGWYFKAVANQFKTWTQAKKAGENSVTPTLEDFAWPWAISAFRESVTSFRPKTVLIQYVKLAYLIDVLKPSSRSQVKCIIDTHDILHLRNECFKERGHPHWIEISRDEEAAALQKFDVVIAIQEEEARLFEAMAPGAKTIVCGHAQPIEPSVNGAQHSYDPNGVLSFGYLGSLNASNSDAVESLVKDWLGAGSKGEEPANDRPAKLLIAGEICEWISESGIVPADCDDIKLLGRVDKLQEFYRQVDVVVNPVEFGTGLKIKNVEALAHGKPLITTLHGMIGLPVNSESAAEVVSDSDEMLAAIESLKNDQEKLRSLTEAAIELSSREFSSNHVYKELKKVLVKDGS
jgi:glycosyltransferase involved in cell wall biosynthesis